MKTRGRTNRGGPRPVAKTNKSSTRLRLFICYRREDAGGRAGRLYDSLTARLGEENIFMDIDTIRAGENFPLVIDRELDSCDVLLALIGPKWLTAKDNAGRRRLDNPKDFVRLEIEHALRRKDVTVVPLLVHDAEMPQARDLPRTLGHLCDKNAFEISDNRWRSDIDKLLDSIARAVAEERRDEAARLEAERIVEQKARQETVGRQREMVPKPHAHLGWLYWLILPLLLIGLAVGIFALIGSKGTSKLVAPSVPRALDASVLRSGVSLTWSRPAQGTVSGYRIYRNGQELATSTNRQSLLRFTDKNVSPYSTFRYTVQAYNNAGNSDRSAAVKVSTGADNRELDILRKHVSLFFHGPCEEVDKAPRTVTAALSCNVPGPTDVRYFRFASLNDMARYYRSRILMSGVLPRTRKGDCNHYREAEGVYLSDAGISNGRVLCYRKQVGSREWSFIEWTTIKIRTYARAFRRDRSDHYLSYWWKHHPLFNR
jgi:TIR domain